MRQLLPTNCCLDRACAEASRQRLRRCRYGGASVVLSREPAREGGFVLQGRWRLRLAWKQGQLTLGREQLPHRAADPVTTITTNWGGGVQPFPENLWDQELGVQWFHTHT